MTEIEVLERLRSLFSGLPDVTETTTFGHPTLQRKGKTFVVLDSYRGEACLCFKTIPPVQRELAAMKGYFPAPYGARHGWMCLRLAGRVGWRRVDRLIAMSYDLVGPARSAGKGKKQTLRKLLPARAVQGRIRRKSRTSMKPER